MKYILILCLISLATFVCAKSPCVGCPKQVEGDDLKKSAEVLQNSLSKLKSGDGPSYTLVKVNSATSQVVSGTLDKINANLKDEDGNEKTCNIEIWSQPWLENGISVTFDCPGEKKITKLHSA